MTLTQKYMKEINVAKSHNDLMGTVIRYSQDCSAYKISWENFMKLHKASNDKENEFRSNKH